MNDLDKMTSDEWLEADGPGGFASGTVSGIRTPRYRALLLVATQSPAGGLVLVNGFDATVETATGSYPFTSRLYDPDVLHPGGAHRIQRFQCDPWPRWTFLSADHPAVVQRRRISGRIRSRPRRSWTTA